MSIFWIASSHKALLAKTNERARTRARANFSLSAHHPDIVATSHIWYKAPLKLH